MDTSFHVGQSRYTSVSKLLACFLMKEPASPEAWSCEILNPRSFSRCPDAALFGELWLVCDGPFEDSAAALVSVHWDEDFDSLQTYAKRHGATLSPPVQGAAPSRFARELGAYFRGELRVFAGPLRPRGTEFQKSVWEALASIPFGELRSYGELAQQIGKPNASRAVGRATGQNPLGIVIPCHRLIGHDGALTGFSGGMERKRWLLRHEGHILTSADRVLRTDASASHSDQTLLFELSER